jgi:hypothetical protein
MKRHRLDDHIVLDLGGIASEVMDWIEVAQNAIQRCSFPNTEINLQIT